MEGNGLLLGMNIGKEERRREALEAARDTRKPSVSLPVDLVQGGKGFHADVPLYVGDRLDGFVVAVFRVETMLNAFLDESTRHGYEIALYQGGEEIYVSPNASRQHKEGMTAGTTLDLYGVPWELHVWPSPATVAAQSSPLPSVALIAGALFAFLVGVAVYFSHAARQRAAHLNLANSVLQAEVSERQRVQRELREERDFAQLLMDKMGQGLTVVDTEGKLEYANPAYTAMLGYSQEELIGKSPFDFVVDEDRHRLEEALESRNAGLTSTYEAHFRRADGSILYAQVKGVPRIINQQRMGSIAVVTDITERKVQEDALIELTIRDELTGLLNRRALDRTLEEEVARHRRYKQPLSVVLLDVDHFKQVNDTHGHHTGDEVLRWVAHTLLSNIRNQDRAARYGGEEFIVILPETDLYEARAAAERLRVILDSTPFVGLTKGHAHPKLLKVTASFGVASLIEGDTPISLVDRADKALYGAKREGRNRVVAAFDLIALDGLKW
jgi:diguanylate cyclase (GGDEF)-like protein/PAS domain S-box-containing protein